jgi:integrase
MRTKAKPLTAAAVDKLKADPTRRVEVPDGLLPGLYLVIQPAPSAKKSWAVRYRDPATKKNMKHTIGSARVFNLAEAREKARIVMQDLAAKKTPAQGAADRESLRPKALREIAERYLIEWSRPRKRSWRADKRMLENDVLPVLGDRTVSTITKRDLVALLQAKVQSEAPIAANRVKSLLSKVFRWAHDNDVIQSNPMQGVRAPSKENQRERVLDDGEIKAFWRATDKLSRLWSAYFRVLLLVAQRRGETANMRWRDIDRDRRVWTIPGTVAKNGKAHAVPLVPEVLAIIDTMPVFEGLESDGFVFSASYGQRGVSAVDRMKCELTELMAGELDREPVPWVVHDLRRTAASGMAALNVLPHVLSKILNHSPASIQGVTAIYNRHGYDKEKRQALEAWTRHVLRLVEGGRSQVVPLRA